MYTYLKYIEEDGSNFEVRIYVMAAAPLPSSDNRYAVRILQAFYNDYNHKCPLTTVKHNLDNSSLLEAIKVNFAYTVGFISLL